jgi:hypothetical protein
LPRLEKVRVLIPIDGISPYKIVHPENQIIVMASIDRLQIDLPKMNYKVFSQASIYGINALEALPVTPISAVGFNFNFSSTEIQVNLNSIIQNAIDDKLSENQIKIKVREFKRTIQFESGDINIIINYETSTNVYLNFHKNVIDSSDTISWLKIPIKNIQDMVDKIAKIFSVELLEEQDEHIE